MAANYEHVMAMSRHLPGVEESTSYGTAALKVKGKLFVRLKEDGVTLVLKTSFEDRTFLMDTDPAIFFITDHYRDYPYVLVRLAKVTRPQLRELLETAWRSVAPKALVAKYESSRR